MDEKDIVGAFGGTFGEDHKEAFQSIVDWTKIKDFKPTEIVDENPFKNINGAYIARIDKIERVSGVSKKSNEKYDFFVMNFQISETVEGDNANNRYFKKTYQNTNDGIQKFMTDLYTSSLSYDSSSLDAFIMSLQGLKDKTIKIRAYEWKPKDKNEKVQTLKIVKELNLRGDKKSEDKSATQVPF